MTNIIILLFLLGGIRMKLEMNPQCSCLFVGICERDKSIIGMVFKKFCQLKGSFPYKIISRGWVIVVNSKLNFLVRVANHYFEFITPSGVLPCILTDCSLKFMISHYYNNKWILISLRITTILPKVSVSLISSADLHNIVNTPDKLSIVSKIYKIVIKI